MANGDRLLDATGNVILDNNGDIVLSNGGTDDGCCCEILVCSACAAGTTPREVTMTIAGVTLRSLYASCRSISASPYVSEIYDTPAINGTYTLTSDVNPGLTPNRCIWGAGASQAIPATLVTKRRRYTQSGCNGILQVQDVFSNFAVYLFGTGPTRTLRCDIGSGGAISDQSWTAGDPCQGSGSYVFTSFTASPSTIFDFSAASVTVTF